MRITPLFVLVLAVPSLVVAACADDVIPLGPLAVESHIRAWPQGKLDLLFVVDDSGSMQEEQASLAARFDGFVAELAALPGGLPDLHIAVVSTDVGIGDFEAGNCAGRGADGVFNDGGLACPLSDGAFITTATPNYGGTLAEQLGCMAQLGTAGCGFEQPLEAVRRALSGPQRDAFVRPDAALAVVILSDEDDCSALPGGAIFDPGQDASDAPLGYFANFRCFEFGVVCEPDDPRAATPDGAPVPQAGCRPRTDSPYLRDPAEVVAFLQGLKPNPIDLMVSVIAGDAAPVAVSRTNEDMDADREWVLEPSCSSPNGVAQPAIRLAAFAAAFGGGGSTSSICDDDLGPALRDAAATITASLTGQCLFGELVDVDQDEDGLQPYCEVDEVEGDVVRRRLPACADGEAPCWRASRDEALCGAAPTQLRLEVDLGDAAATPGTSYLARCTVAR